MVRVRTTFAAIAASAALAGAASVAAQVGSSCPLPLSQQLDSIRAFKPIASFLTSEPRCVNCHGGVNPFIDGIGSDPEDATAPSSLAAHGGGRIQRERPRAADDTPLIEDCRDCHNHLEPRRDGSPSLWTTAPSFLSFVNKDAAALCRQIKRATGTHDHFLGHLRDDNGGNQFARAAFAGDRALDPEIFDLRDVPSLTHAQLMRLAEQWVEDMGGSFRGDERCGCEVELEGTFSQTQSAPLTAAIGTITHNYTVTGRLVWKRRQEAGEENVPMSPSFGTDTVSWFLRPKAGEIAVEVNNESRGVGGGQCTVTGMQTFRFEQLPAAALQHLWLELAEDGRYKLSLGVISRYLLTPVELVCQVAGRKVRSTEMWDTAVAIGVQQGTVGEEGLVGRLDPPVRLGAATINGQWSFATIR